jgi:general secretion pathway protein I
MGSSACGTRQPEQHVALVQAAYDALWLSFPSRSPPPSGSQSDQSMEHAWRADIEPFAVDFGAPAGGVLWVPLKIRLRVQSGSGATIDLDGQAVLEAVQMMSAGRTNNVREQGFTLIETLRRWR